MALDSITADKASRVAVVHYHLRPGGVTRVIESTLQGFVDREDLNAVVLTGEPYEGEQLSKVRVVEGLSYAEATDSQSAKALAAALKNAAKEGLDGQMPDIWHFHNHALGKVSAMADTVAVLAKEGARLLLQIHDFAEDGRPDNFAVLGDAALPYPMVSHVHYAVLNSRDRRFLIKAGIPEAQVHALPNPVEAVGRQARNEVARSNKKQLVLYPTRGIRRKNLGEAVLLAALLGNLGTIAITRAPDNPVWRERHDAWRNFAAKHKIDVHFGVVDRLSPADTGFSGVDDTSFSSWIRAADMVMTTSVAEGFGLVFLEAMLTGHLLVGRDLPEITEDFKEVDLQFPGLYRCLRVPLAWVGGKRAVGKIAPWSERFSPGLWR